MLPPDFVPLSAGVPKQSAPPNWEWELLTSLAKLESGHTPSRSHPEWWGGDIPWIALPDIRALDGRVAERTLENTNGFGIANSAARVLPEGTVVMSRTASVGFVTIMGRPMATSQDFVNWICGAKLVPEFLAFLLRDAREYIRALSSGAVHKTVYFPTVESFRVCVPSRAEQERIVGLLQVQLESAESARAAMEARLNAIDLLPAALLRRAFRGEL